MPRRFFIVDQSLKDLRGHHYEYDRSVAEAAQKQGWEPVIVCHRSLSKAISIPGVTILRLFRVTWDGGGRLAMWRDRLTPLARWLDPRRAKRHAVIHATTAGGMIVRERPGLERAVRSGGRDTRRLLGAFGKVSRLPGIGLVIKGVAAIPAFIVGKFAGTSRAVAHGKAFRKEFLRAIDGAGAGPEDVVFLHTLSVQELEQILLALTSVPLDQLPGLHLLLRRDAFEDLSTHASGLNLGSCLKRFAATGLWPSRVQFYSDTEHLCRQYETLSDVRFSPLPIPFRHEMIDAAKAARSDGDDRLHVVYLGDARREKGYHHLPGMVHHLWSRWARTGKARFTFQSNFNVDGGEPGILAARRQLRQLPDGTVTLLDRQLSDTEYYGLLAHADVLVIPYDATAYRARSSGVLAEALVAGQPVVVTAGTWMADMIDDHRGRAFTDPDDLGPAVEAVLEEISAIKTSAEEFAPSWRDRHSAGELVRQVIEHQGAMVHLEQDEGTTPPTILWFMHADSFLHRTGSEQVARNQLAYFKRHGYRVYGVLLGMDLTSPAYDRHRWASDVGAAISDLGLAGAWMLHFSHGPLTAINNYRVIRSILAGKRSMEIDERIMNGFEIPDDLRAFVRTHSIDGVFINYIATKRLLDRIGVPRHTPVVCEMHDIMAHQHALQMGADIDRADFATECRRLDECAGVIAINEVEQEVVESNLKRASIVHVPQTITPPSGGWSLLAGHESLGELLHSAGIGGSERDMLLGEQVEKLSSWDTLDLLFVGSGHPPNVHGFTWFYNEVFLPHLAKMGTTVLVAGSASWDLTKVIEHPQIAMVGRVDDLDPLYAAARVIILPIRQGAGFSIKTLEAMTHSTPVVATPQSLRGLESTSSEIASYDDPLAFAGAIKRLLGNVDLRREAAAIAFGAADVHGRRCRYEAAMAQAMATAGIDASSDDPPSGDVSVWTEWDPAIGAFNRVIAAVLSYQACDEADLVVVQAANEGEHSIALSGISTSAFASGPEWWQALAGKTTEVVDIARAITEEVEADEAPSSAAAPDRQRQR